MIFKSDPHLAPLVTRSSHPRAAVEVFAELAREGFFLWDHIAPLGEDGVPVLCCDPWLALTAAVTQTASMALGMTVSNHFEQITCFQRSRFFSIRQKFILSCLIFFTASFLLTPFKPCFIAPPSFGGGAAYGKKSPPFGRFCRLENSRLVCYPLIRLEHLFHYYAHTGRKVFYTWPQHQTLASWVPSLKECSSSKAHQRSAKRHEALA